MTKSREPSKITPIENTIIELKKLQANLWGAITDLSENDEYINIFSSEIIKLKASCSYISHVVQDISKKSEFYGSPHSFSLTTLNCEGEKVCGRYAMWGFVDSIEGDSIGAPMLDDRIIDCSISGLDIPTESLDTVKSLYDYIKSILPK